MADRGPNQDEMNVGAQPKFPDPSYRDASYLGTDPADEEEVRDLGFIVDDHDDRRAALTGGWQRLDDLDTDEPLETNRSGPIPHETALRERGVTPDAFATDYHVTNAAAEAQEEDFVTTSMLRVDPEMYDGMEDFTSDTIEGMHGEQIGTDIVGHVNGAAAGLGTSLPQDLGSGGFGIEDNPLEHPQGAPISGPRVGAIALGQRGIADMGDDEELEELADRAVRDMEREAA